LLHFAAAELVPGFSLIADLTGLEERVAAADWVITGEGSLDAQSLDGKGPFGIAQMARKYQKTICAFCGTADATARESGWFDHIGSLSSTGLPLDVLMQQAAVLLEKQVDEALQSLCPKI
jgi:glycerate 2-kinase